MAESYFVQIKGIQHSERHILPHTANQIKIKWLRGPQMVLENAFYDEAFIERFRAEHASKEPPEHNIPTHSPSAPYDLSEEFVPLLHYWQPTDPHIHLLPEPTGLVRPKLEVILALNPEYERIDEGTVSRELQAAYKKELKLLDNFDTRHLRVEQFDRETKPTEYIKTQLSPIRCR